VKYSKSIDSGLLATQIPNMGAQMQKRLQGGCRISAGIKKPAASWIRQAGFYNLPVFRLKL